MRRAWFIVKVCFLGSAPLATALGVPASGFGALVGGLAAANSEGAVAVPVGIGIGIAIGLALVALLLATVQIPLYVYLFVTHFSRTDSLDARPRRTVRLNVPPAKAMLLCREAALQIPGAKLDEDASSVDRVAAGTPLRWESWGERITLDVRGAPEPDRCEVVISSRPAMATDMVDFGVNERHVEAAIAHLHKSGAIDDPQNGIASSRESGDGV